jgi:hypothetical protein
MEFYKAKHIHTHTLKQRIPFFKSIAEYKARKIFVRVTSHIVLENLGEG